MSNDSGLFRTARQLADSGAVRLGADWMSPDGTRMVPLYEAKSSAVSTTVGPTRNPMMVGKTSRLRATAGPMPLLCHATGFPVTKSTRGSPPWGGIVSG